MKKTQIKNDIDNRYKQTKKKCKTKKQCLINNIKFMYQNLVTSRREYIVETPCSEDSNNIDGAVNKTLVHKNIKSVTPKSEKEKERLNKEKDKLTKELARSKGMLSNEKFLNNAKPEKVQEEKDKLAKYEQMMAQVEQRLAQMK